eukprot:7389310-Prymnesium_polylepis.2
MLGQSRLGQPSHSGGAEKARRDGAPSGGAWRLRPCAYRAGREAAVRQRSPRKRCGPHRCAAPLCPAARGGTWRQPPAASALSSSPSPPAAPGA